MTSCFPGTPSVNVVTAMIADQLGEHEERALLDLTRLVEACGQELALRLLAEAQEIEAAGGMLTRDKSRRRTPGGVFFENANRRLRRFDRDLWWEAIGRHRWERMADAPRKATSTTSSKPATSPAPTPLAPTSEEIDTSPPWQRVRVQLQLEITGRPTQIIEHTGYAMLLFTMPFKEPLLQAGVPTPSVNPSQVAYRVFLGRKQWLKIKDALVRPDTSLSIQIFRGNGSVLLDPEQGEYLVYPGNRVQLRHHNRNTAKDQEPPEAS